MFWVTYHQLQVEQFRLEISLPSLSSTLVRVHNGTSRSILGTTTLWVAFPFFTWFSFCAWEQAYECSNSCQKLEPGRGSVWSQVSLHVLDLCLHHPVSPCSPTKGHLQRTFQVLYPPNKRTLWTSSENLSSCLRAESRKSPNTITDRYLLQRFGDPESNPSLPTILPSCSTLTWALLL